MPKPPRKLSEVVKSGWAPEGHNDGRWFLMEHQIYQARVSLQQARLMAEQIGDHPENAEERELASAVLEYLTPAYIASAKCLADSKSLLSGTEVAERIGGQKNG
jgi:hypothetical protein